MGNTTSLINEGATLHLVWRMRDGMYHPTSGRAVDRDLPAHLSGRSQRITVSTPGGDVHVEVSLECTAEQLLEAATAVAAKTAQGAAADCAPRKGLTC